MAAKPRVLYTTITGGANHTGVVYFCGYSVRETAGAVAEIRFRLAAVGGVILAVVSLPANSSYSVMFPSALSTPTGVYVQVVSGAAEGILYSGKP